MVTAVSQHVHHLGHHFGFLKSFILNKTVANIKHVVIASNRSIIRNRVEKEDIRTSFFQKVAVFFSNFNLHEYFCINSE